MNLKETHIPRKLTNQLLHLAQQSPRYEICGLVGSKNGIPSSCYPVDNVANHPEQRFLLDARQQIEAMTKIRNQGEELFAIYHSHPSSPAVPSAIDVEQAAYPEALYLIISLNTKGLLEMRGFQIDHRKTSEIPLILGED